MSTTEKKDREYWSSRAAFYFAAVGSAVGFGNVWRFPSLAFKYGGGAFFIPYLLALVLIGLPILFLEIALGQFTQTGDVGVFSSFHRRMRGVGFASVACSFVLVTYYSMLIAWVIHGFFDSFTDNAPWSGEDITGGSAIDYFIAQIIGTETLPEDGDGTPTQFVAANVGYSFLTWALMFLCVAFGIKTMGRLTYFTMGFPILCLLIFTGKGLSLEGAEEGIRQYIGIWDLSILRTEGSVWTVAVTQIFFSLGITFGVMTAYGSHCNPNEPAFVNSCVVAASNSMFSFIAGFAVFSAVGHLSVLEDTEIKDLSIGGFGLVFGAWPAVFSSLSGGEHWVRLLFVMLFLLGIDSAFSLLEAGLTVARDSLERATGNPRPKLVAAIFCLVGWGFSLIYALDAGLSFLDVVDYYINFIFLFVGLLQTFSCGWLYNIEHQIESFGQVTVLAYMFTSFGSVILASGIWFGLDDADTALWAGFVALFGFYSVGMAFVMYQLSTLRASNPERWPTMGSIFYDLTFQNMIDLKNQMEPVIGIVPVIWCFLIKHFIPFVLVILFLNEATFDNGKDGRSKFGHYGAYAQWPFQTLGYLSFAFACLCFLIGLVAPGVYEPLVDAEKEAEMKEAIRALHKKDGDDVQDKEVPEMARDYEKGDKVEEAAADDVAAA